MTDNVINFPNREVIAEVELEEDYFDVVEAVNTMLEMQVAGMMVTSDVQWNHVMDACLSMAVSAGLRSGMASEKIEEMLHNASIKEVMYDA